MQQQQDSSGRVLSYTYGAEEFVYLLGKCLVNYGGVIGSGMFQTAFVSTTEEGRYEKRTATAAAGSFKYASREVGGDAVDGERKETRSTKKEQSGSEPGETRTTTADGDREGQQIPGGFSDRSSPPVREGCRNRGNHDAEVTSGARSVVSPVVAAKHKDMDENELQLRDSIRNMKVNFEEEGGGGSVLDFAEVAGLEGIKLALEEFATFFLHFPHLTRNLRQRATTGILLFGPQGTGKTLLLKSFAQKYNMSLYDIRASAIMSKYVGESEKFIRALFREVRDNTPAVLMLDECDGLLCNPTADASQSHSYRLLQNELKNQWSDLIYSRDEVIVIGATNKPHDIDMDGFGRRLSLKLHVELPNEKSCRLILKGALDRLRHRVEQEDFVVLGRLCHERGFSGYDMDCLVEGVLRRALRGVTVARFFKKIHWNEQDIVVPCEESDPGASEGPWSKITTNSEEVSYQPFDFGTIKAAILRTRSTVDERMIQKHVEFASQYGTDDY